MKDSLFVGMAVLLLIWSPALYSLYTKSSKYEFSRTVICEAEVNYGIFDFKKLTETDIVDNLPDGKYVVEIVIRKQK